MKTHLNHNGCNLYSVEDKHFLSLRGCLYIISKEWMVKIMKDFSTPEEVSCSLIDLVEKETFKKIEITKNVK